MSEDEAAIQKLTQHANEKHDGHFTIMKFTGNIRVECGTQDFYFPTIKEGLKKFREMPVGLTLSDAVEAAISNCEKGSGKRNGKKKRKYLSQNGGRE